MNSVQKQFMNMLTAAIADIDPLTIEAINSAAADLEGLRMFAGLTQDEKDHVLTTVLSMHSVHLGHGILINEKGHEKWFLARKGSLEMRYWERYKKHLQFDKEFPVSVINTMDDVLDSLTDLLGDPTREVSYKRRGLIIGDVQSGKTANYTGLICKAVDASYKVVVLLTGTIEKLRQQTQGRIDEGFVGADSSAMMKKLDSVTIGVGKYDPSTRPMVLTSTTTDFKQHNATSLGFDLRNINGPVIFVIKKNVSILKRLNKWLATYNQNGEQKIDHSLLVIDDEADNASVNTKADVEDTPTAINNQIRILLASFTKSSYVGYTATPYANIFIDPETTSEMKTDDLFPKDYIYVLDSPTNYVGAKRIFAENGEDSFMLVSINNDASDPESIEAILPMKHKQYAGMSMLPEDMKTAIETFVLANTIEDIEGLGATHRSMLINVSRFTAVQDRTVSLVRDYLKELQNASRSYGALEPELACRNPYIQRLRDTYHSVYKDLEYDWAVVQSELCASGSGIVVQAFNMNGGQEVSFSDYKDGLRVIAVGGMSLSRGLTLEGLVVSYFYRNSRMYDTLMQMGRWFGYRGKYKRLCRIWMTDESIEWYRYINSATEELKRDIKSFQDTNLTPMDFGIRVRSDMTALIVTAQNKMRTGTSCNCMISLSGICVETPEIFTSEDVNEQNRLVVVNLVDTLVRSGKEVVTFSTGAGSKGRPGFKDVERKYVLDFLHDIQVSPKNEGFNLQTLRSFIREDYKGTELQHWDIVFASGNAECDEQEDYGHGIKLRRVKRTYSVENEGRIFKMTGSKRRLGTSSDGIYGMSPEAIADFKEKHKDVNCQQKDYFINIVRNPQLIIYSVYLSGERKIVNGEVVIDEDAAGAKRVVYGFGIGIPTLENQETKYAKYVLNKIACASMLEGTADEGDSEDDD